jgi:hypothetical protein
MVTENRTIQINLVVHLIRVAIGSCTSKDEKVCPAHSSPTEKRKLEKFFFWFSRSAVILFFSLISLEMIFLNITRISIFHGSLQVRLSVSGNS